jgi:methyl-accepting chemotaxis protein
MKKTISMQLKLILVLVASAVIPLVGVMTFAIINSTAALQTAEENKLVALRDVKIIQTRELFGNIKKDMAFLTQTSNTLANGVKDLIQYHVEMGIGADDNFDDSSSRPHLTKTYKQINGTLQPYFENYLKQYNYYDIKIVCKKHGHVLYTFAKESDNLQNIRVGKYRESQLAIVWQNVVKSDTVYLSDLEKYAPSHDIPAMFLAAPIKHRETNETLAVIVVEVPIDFVNKIVKDSSGMGKTGETYLVGPDFIMRSDSRILYESAKKTTALTQRADTEPVKSAFKDETGIMTANNYGGEAVLSAFSPVTLLNQKWVIVSEVKVTEAFDAVNKLTITTLVILAVVIALLIVLGFLFARSISVPLGKITTTLSSGADQMTSASSQLATSSQEIAGGATEQASSIEETTSSMVELSSMVRQNLQNAKEASTLADRAASSSKDGFAQMEKMLESMKEINKSSGQISRVIKIIDDIAFQTNILALNAAVEAARAGEAGMGFAVVADEVKNLANRSAGAAKETSGMIEDSIRKTEEGLGIATRMADVFRDLLDNSQKVSEMSKEVETASTQQDTGINQVNKAIVQFDEVVQANAGAAEETASSAEELQAQVDMLNTMVGELLFVVTGKDLENGRQRIEIGKRKTSGETRRSLAPVRAASSSWKKSETMKKNTAEKLIPFEEDEEFKNAEKP